MKKVLAAVLTTLLVVAMALAAVFLLVGATITVAQMASPLLRAIAVTLELILGVLLLVGTVYVATRVAVLLFSESSPDPRP